MSIQLSENEPRVRYTLAEGVSQSAFSVPFEFFDDADLVVYVDTVAKAEGADYTVSGGGGSTGTVTFLSALVGIVGGSEIVIVRRIPVERVTDFLAGSDINRAALNEQLDILTAMVADVNDKASLAVRVSDLGGPLSSTIPSASLRSGKYFGFDANGEVVMREGTGGDEAGFDRLNVRGLTFVRGARVTAAFNNYITFTNLGFYRSIALLCSGQSDTDGALRVVEIQLSTDNGLTWTNAASIAEFSIGGTVFSQGNSFRLDIGLRDGVVHGSRALSENSFVRFSSGNYNAVRIRQNTSSVSNNNISAMLIFIEGEP